MKIGDNYRVDEILFLGTDCVHPGNIFKIIDMHCNNNTHVCIIEVEKHNKKLEVKNSSIKTKCTNMNDRRKKIINKYYDSRK